MNGSPQPDLVHCLIKHFSGMDFGGAGDFQPTTWRTHLGAVLELFIVAGALTWLMIYPQLRHGFFSVKCSETGWALHTY